MHAFPTWPGAGTCRRQFGSAPGRGYTVYSVPEGRASVLGYACPLPSRFYIVDLIGFLQITYPEDLVDWLPPGPHNKYQLRDRPRSVFGSIFESVFSLLFYRFWTPFATSFCKFLRVCCITFPNVLFTWVLLEMWFASKIGEVSTTRILLQRASGLDTFSFSE